MSTFVLFLIVGSWLMVLGGLCYLIYKLRRLSRLVLHEMQEDLPRFVKGEIENCFRQAEALSAILVDLRLQTSLPPTRNWAASPDLLRELMLHVLQFRPASIVECGSGVSTIVLAHCLRRIGAGHLYSFEHLPDHADSVRNELNRHGLEANVTILTAPLRTYAINDEQFLWYAMDELPALRVDMLLIDGPPAVTGPLARYPAGPLLFGLLNSKAAIFLDDSAREQEQTILARWSQEFPRLRQEVRPCEKGCAVLWNEP